MTYQDLPFSASWPPLPCELSDAWQAGYMETAIQAALLDLERLAKPYFDKGEKPEFNFTLVNLQNTLARIESIKAYEYARTEMLDAAPTTDVSAYDYFEEKKNESN